MTTEFKTDVSLNKTSTNTNDSNADLIADDTSVNDAPNDENTENVIDNVVIESDVMKVIDIGNELKEKRLELGFDERNVATKLKIPIDQVRALESSDFSYFRSVTFARGFLKSYCRLLELDYVVMVAAFDKERAGAETTIKPVDKVHKQTHLGDPIVIFISVVIVAVLVFLVFWWPSTSSVTSLDDIVNETVETIADPETSSTANETLELEEPTNNKEVDVQSSVDQRIIAPAANAIPSKAIADADEKPVNENDVVTGLSAETVAILKEAGVSPDEVVRATKVVPATETSVVQQTVAYQDDVEIAFSGDCWAEIRDASGTILFSGVKSAGSSLALTGDAPYRVVLGYAKGVSSLIYKGEQFDFSPFTRKDLARFELK
ncbi:hypothetical protein MUS1_10475 [Marinomonas ushuaiensis DSM 15871]|uniref:Cytoskeleton protein RodZ-like C-terminal domain-containing protein n=1 Tax=Marinomonas ushuaiensis DSM 15871 TaxID=1122207 RepID=X7E5T9_9GAMM|nr:RodZ domain-containing protein [Marinomonas ushuaiensis]ETX11394.1 hypothetical protein MUS1_10475 [Marinomonas ushuaiensis DSM 15871]